MSREFFRSLAREAAAGYPARDRVARHFAYGKLTGDPVFAHFLRAGSIPDRARVLDLGCGQALLAALLFAARARHARGEWPAGWPAPPDLTAYTGVDLRSLDVERARTMAGHWAPGQSLHPQAPGGTTRAAPGAATFVASDIRTAQLPAADVVLILDVLHYVDYPDQLEVLRRVRDALSPRGTLLLRVGDQSESLRFRFTVLVDRLSIGVRGLRLPRLWCRPAAEWRGELERLGFAVRAEPMSEGTPFANVLFVARYDAAA